MELLGKANVYLIQFGTGLCLLLAIIEFAHNNRRMTAVAYAALCQASIQLRFGLYAADVVLAAPYTLFAFTSTVFCMGPLVLLIASDMLAYPFFGSTGGSTGRRRLGWHFAPAVLTLLIEVYILANHGTVAIRALAGQVLYDPQLNWTAWVLVGSCLHELGYFGYATYGFYVTNHRYDLQFSRMAITMISIPVLAISLCLAGLLLRIEAFYHVGSSLFTVTLAFAFVFGMKGPTLLHTVRREIRIKKYANSQLSQVNVGELKERLTLIMEEEQVFTREDLTIHSLAEELGVPYKQLSELLNGSYGQNFNQYINSYRIGRAKELLMQDRQASVLTIAYRVGYGSKATFNAQFKNLVGVTPSEFRKQEDV